MSVSPMPSIYRQWTQKKSIPIELAEAGAAKEIYVAAKKRLRSIVTFARLYDRYKFDDRRQGLSTLVVMLAGYKQELWGVVLPRLEAALPAADVCIVSPGKRDERLATICAQKGWSYLSTATNDVGLAQNVALKLHEKAEMIVKVDEDMFLLPDTIRILLDEYAEIKSEGVIDPGYLAPMIPLNGFTYRYLLTTLGLLDAFEARFGLAKMAAAGIPIQNDPAAARWIWEHTSPLEDTAKVLTSAGRERILCPIRFSIGLIVFERTFWEFISYFYVNRRKLLMGISTLGGDEAWITTQALEFSRPGIITTATLAGHFAFGPQYAGQKALFNLKPELFGV